MHSLLVIKVTITSATLTAVTEAAATTTAKVTISIIKVDFFVLSLSKMDTVVVKRTNLEV